MRNTIDLACEWRSSDKSVPKSLLRTSVQVNSAKYPLLLKHCLQSSSNEICQKLLRAVRCILLFILSMTMARKAVAQVLVLDSAKLKDLEQITIVADKSRVKIGSGAYIDNRTLALLNQPNINHVLRLVPGVNIRDEEGFGLRPNIGLRGTAVNRSAKITLMEDGILIAPAPYSDPSAYYFPTFARMHGVEVLKGSSQIKYGPYTIGGAINLLSTPIPNNFKGYVQLAYGSFGTNMQRIWVGDSRRNFDYLLEINRLASRGFKQLDGGGNTGFDRRDIVGKFRWHTLPESRISQSVTLKLIQASELGNESYLGLTYEDYKANPLRRYAATQKDVLNLTHQHISLSHVIIPFRNVSVNTKAYYSGTFRDWSRVNTINGTALNTILANPAGNRTTYEIMTGAANGSIEYRSAARTFYSRGLETQVQYSLNLGPISSRLQAGLRYHEDQADRLATQFEYTMKNRIMVLTAAGVTGDRENQIRNAGSTATFLHGHFTYKNLNITPGIRYEDIRFKIRNYGNNDPARLGLEMKSAVNSMRIMIPGIGLNYKINTLMDVYAGIHKGFSPPGMPSLSTGLEQARPETAVNYELGYRLEQKRLRLDVSGFLSNYHNILGSDNVSGGGAGTGNMFNAGNAVIQGVEFSFSSDIYSGISKSGIWKIPFQLMYTFTDARFKDSFNNADGDWGTGMVYNNFIIPFIPAHALTLNVGLEHKKLTATFSARYIGTSRTKPGKDALRIPTETTAYNDVNSIPAFLMIDFSANYRMSGNFSFYGTLNNLTNNRSMVANLPNGYRPNMPLALMLGLKADIR